MVINSLLAAAAVEVYKYMVSEMWHLVCLSQQSSVLKYIFLA